jgi:hypothetical protein
VEVKTFNLPEFASDLGCDLSFSSWTARLADFAAVRISEIFGLERATDRGTRRPSEHLRPESK